MKKIPGQTREIIMNMYNGFCGCKPDCTDRATEIHHRLSDTDGNVKNFPLFINSAGNLIPIFTGHHGQIRKIAVQEARAQETWLELFKEGSV